MMRGGNMNERKIAFILCMTNEQEYAECKRYLDRLVVPDGFETDVITIQEAPSMCAGYNAGMQSTDAKYKVYIHQDTFIINKNFIADMLKVFEDENVGLMGTLGARKLPSNGHAVSSWDTGKVYHNGNNYDLGYQEKGRIYTEVEAVDGLLIATQYDIAFREDIFFEFDFYDISICMEYRRAGFKLAVANQDEPWVFHNNKFSKMTKYDNNRKKFIDEYRADFELKDEDKELDDIEYEIGKVESLKAFEKLIDEGHMEAVCKTILGQKYDYLWLKDITILSRIYVIERDKNSAFQWNKGISDIYDKLNDLKNFLKRVEYNVEMEGDEYRYYGLKYSFETMVMIAASHCIKAKSVVDKIQYYVGKKYVGNIKSILTDEHAWFEEKVLRDNLQHYNLEKWKEKKIPIVIDSLENINSVDIMINVLKDAGIIDDAIVFSKKDGKGSKILCEENVTVIIAGSMYFKYFLYENEWNVGKVIYIGNREDIYNYTIHLENTTIEIKSIEDIANEIYKTNEYSLYVTLGQMLSQKNDAQAYLAYEQAKYYSKNSKERMKVIDMQSKLIDVAVNKTSIIILSYNTLEKTKNCVESIKNSTNSEDYDIVIVDNGSVDGSVEYLQSLMGVKVIFNRENKGFAGGCNQGIALSEKENDIWLLNSDTLVPENALFWLRMGLYSDENIGATGSVSNYCPNYQNIVETNVDDTNYKIIAEQYNKYKEDALEQKNWLVGFSMLIKREALEKTGYLDERFFPGNFEDNDLSYRLIEKRYKLMLCHNSFVFHYGSTSFKKSKIVSSALIDNKARFVEKWKFDPEDYTAIKTRHISMIDRKKYEEFSAIDLNAGVGATIARIKYMYKNAYAVGVEERQEAARIANLNGCKVSNDVDRYFDYVLTDRVTKEVLADAMACMKYNGVLIGCQENRYYNELNNKNIGLTADEIITILNEGGFKIIDFSFEKGTFLDGESISKMCKKYNCDRKFILAKKYYFIAKSN